MLAIAFAIYPVLLILSASLDAGGSLNASRLIPEEISFESYREFFNDPFNPFPLWYWNSLKVASITTALGVLLTAFAAFAFSRFRFRGRRNLLLGLVLVQVFPVMLAIVAVYLLIQQLGRYLPPLGLNSHWSLILVYLGSTLGINVWLMKGFFDSIPRELDESARVDGASDWQIFWLIIFPLVRPILAVIAILTFIGTFGEFIIARVLLTNTQELTFMIGLYQFISTSYNENWGVFAAGSLLAAIPIVVVYILLQDQIVGGLTAGSVKG
jgi:ABC-type maltose transport system permease subunit